MLIAFQALHPSRQKWIALESAALSILSVSKESRPVCFLENSDDKAASKRKSTRILSELTVYARIAERNLEEDDLRGRLHWRGSCVAR